MKYLRPILIAIALSLPIFAFSASCNTNSLSLARASSQSASEQTSDFGIASGAFTWEGWMYLNSLPSSGQNYTLFFISSDAGNTFDLLYYINNGGTLQFQVVRNRGNVAQDNVLINSTLSTATWYHIALTYDGTTITLYKAVVGGTHSSLGTLTSSGQGTGASGCKEYSQGASETSQTCNTANLGNFFDGLLDDARVWSSARSVANLDNNFQTELVGSETGLIAYYKYNNAYTDSTSGAHTLSPLNSPTFSTTVPFAGSCGGATFQLWPLSIF